MNNFHQLFDSLGAESKSATKPVKEDYEDEKEYSKALIEYETALSLSSLIEDKTVRNRIMTEAEKKIEKSGMILLPA